MLMLLLLSTVRRSHRGDVCDRLTERAHVCHVVVVAVDCGGWWRRRRSSVLDLGERWSRLLDGDRRYDGRGDDTVWLQRRRDEISGECALGRLLLLLLLLC